MPNFFNLILVTTSHKKTFLKKKNATSEPLIKLDGGIKMCIVLVF